MDADCNCLVPATKKTLVRAALGAIATNWPLTGSYPAIPVSVLVPKVHVPPWKVIERLKTLTPPRGVRFPANEHPIVVPENVPAVSSIMTTFPPPAVVPAIPE
jgi:hypothetical protein